MSARPFTPTELACLESHLHDARRYRDAMLVKVGTQVGYRITELISWTVGQVVTPAGEVAREVTVTRALLKGGSGKKKRSIKSRRVVLNEKARAAIRDYIDSLGYVPIPDEFLFRSREGGNRPLHRSQAHRILVQACEQCGIDTTRISTHSLRKTFVRAVCDASGHDIIRTMKVVQHSSPVITARYLESTQSELDDVVLGLPSPGSCVRPGPRPRLMSSCRSQQHPRAPPGFPPVPRYAHFVAPNSSSLSPTAFNRAGPIQSI
jgi:integrase